MAQQTTNYHLQKYEATDSPDLTTKYNASMDTLDAKLKEVSDQAQTASNKVATNSGILNALGATDTNTAGTSKTKWDKAASDAASALQKVEAIPRPQPMPQGLQAFCTALGLTANNAEAFGTALNHFLNRTPATQNGGYTVNNLANTKLTAEGLLFVPQRREKGE